MVPEYWSPSQEMPMNNVTACSLMLGFFLLACRGADNRAASWTPEQEGLAAAQDFITWRERSDAVMDALGSVSVWHASRRIPQARDAWAQAYNGVLKPIFLEPSAQYLGAVDIVELEYAMGQLLQDLDDPDHEVVQGHLVAIQAKLDRLVLTLDHLSAPPPPENGGSRQGPS